MVALQHIYLTAHGEFTVAPWTDERAQIGLRLAMFAEGTDPAAGTPFTIPDNHGDIALDTGIATGTHGTLSRAWTARMGGAPSTSNADAAFQVDLAEDFWKFLDAVKAQTANVFRWTHVKIAPITASGAYGFTGAATYDFTSPIVGGASGSMMPPEVAACISLRAPISGRTGRGRVYMPALSAGAAAAAGTIGSSTRTAFANAMATLIDDLDDAPGAEEYGPIVMVTSAGKATGVRPSEVRVGDHYDAQRRRQHQALETYTTVSVA